MLHCEQHEVLLSSATGRPVALFRLLALLSVRSLIEINCIIITSINCHRYPGANFMQLTPVYLLFPVENPLNHDTMKHLLNIRLLLTSTSPNFYSSTKHTVHQLFSTQKMPISWWLISINCQPIRGSKSVSRSTVNTI